MNEILAGLRIRTETSVGFVVQCRGPHRQLGMWGHLHPTAGFSAPAGCRLLKRTLHAESSPVDGSRSGSRSLAQAEVLRALARVYRDPLIELAQLARASVVGPTLDAQLDAWAAKWHLEPMREVAELHVYYWAGTPDAADALRLLNPPSSLAWVDLRPRPSTVVEGEPLEPIVAPWSLPPVVWEPLEQLNPYNPLHPLLADPNVETEADGVARFRAHYKARKKITTPVPRPRKLTRHAEWYVLHVVAEKTIAEIAAMTFDTEDGAVRGRRRHRERGDISTVAKAVRQIRSLLDGN